MVRWSAELYRWPLIVVSAAAALAVLYPIGPRIADYLSDGGAAGPPAPSDTSSTDPRALRYDIGAVADAHLFGEPEKEAPTDVGEAPETKLQLRLVGLIASASDRYARALIGVNAGDVNDYGVGEDIEGTQATIRSVEPRRVLLDRNGAVESLHLKTPDLKGGSGSGSGPARSTQYTTSAPVGDGAEPGDARTRPDRGSVKENPVPYSGNDTGIRYGGVQERSGRQTKLPF